MNKLNKVFLVIIIILVIALGIVTSLYFNMRQVAHENLEAYLNAEKQITELIKEKSKL